MFILKDKNTSLYLTYCMEWVKDPKQAEMYYRYEKALEESEKLNSEIENVNIEVVTFQS